MSVGVGPDSNVETVRVEGKTPESTVFEVIIEDVVDSDGNIKLPSTMTLVSVRITPVTVVDGETTVTLKLSIIACLEVTSKYCFSYKCHCYKIQVRLLFLMHCVIHYNICNCG